MVEKICSKCKTSKNLNKDFYNHTRSLDGKQPWCKDCTRKGNTAYIRKRRMGNLATDNYYDSKLMEQGYSCAICRRHFSEFSKSLAMDHNHLTGKLRGLLCDNCNHILGKASDSLDILRSAISYLEFYNSKDR